MDMKLSQYDDAEKNLREAIQIDPQALNYHGMLSAVFEKEGKFEEAERQKGIELQLKLQNVRKGKNPD